MAPATVLISGFGIAGPALAYWLARRGHRPVLVERTDGLRTGGHAVDIRGTAICDDVEVVFDDSVRTLVSDGDGRVGVEFERGASREVDLVVGADGQHSSIRE